MRRARRLLVVIASAALLLGLASPASAATPTWLTGETIESTAQASIDGLSCPSATTCLAAAANSPVVQDNGVSYEPNPDPDPSGVLTAVSCARGTDFCIFVDDSGGAFSYSNGRFGSVVHIDGHNRIDSVSCASSSLCMAIDDNNKVFKYASGTWDAGKQLSTGTHSFNMSFVNVSCASSSFCVALANTSDGELYYRWNGSAWSSPSGPFDASGGHTVSLSCTSTAFCLETDETGFASVFNGTSWSTPKHVDHPSGISFPVLYSACVGTSCVAVDTYDNFVQTSDGQTWSSAVNIGARTGMTARGINSVTCATATLCVAGDGEGDATTYAVPPNPGKPSLTGKPSVGQTLTLTHASVQTTPVWYHDDWFRCDNPGTTCTINPISTSKSSYTLVGADAGKYINARETFGFGFDEEGFLAGGNLTSNIVGPIVKTPPTISSLSPRAGSTAGGNTVTINGSGFASGATVRFSAAGSARATTFVSSTKLTVIAPAHAAGTVPVFVTTAGGTSTATNSDLYAFGAPTISSVSPRAGSTAGGNTVTINGSGFLPGAVVKFGATASATVTFVSGTQVKTVAPAHSAGNVDVTVTTAGGTSITSAADRYTYS